MRCLLAGSLAAALRCQLPVLLEFDLTRLVVIVVDEVECCAPFLTTIIELFLIRRGFWRLSRGQVDPDKTESVDVNVYAEKIVLGFVEVGQILVARGFGEPTVQPVGPSVVSARKDTVRPMLTLDNTVCAMPTDVVESIDVAFTVLGYNKPIARRLILDPISRTPKALLVRHQQPSPRKDGPSFQLVRLLRGRLATAVQRYGGRHGARCFGSSKNLEDSRSSTLARNANGTTDSVV